VLSPKEWFQEGHGIIGGKKDLTRTLIPRHAKNGRIYIWTPPPVIADVALEECAKVIHKRMDAYQKKLYPDSTPPFGCDCCIKFPILCLNYPLAHGTSHLQCTNLCLLASLFHFSPGILGFYKECRCWWNWSGNCAKCSAPVRKMEGIFCANFCKPRSGWPACQKVWYAKCYKCLGQGKIPLKIIQDEKGNRWYKHDIRVQHINHGVRGAHASIHFQREDCWMVNLKGRPTGKGLDDTYLMLIRQASLDAMGGQAVATIQGHAAALKRSVYNCHLFRKMPTIPP
jgi:hypothetical protein